MSIIRRGSHFLIYRGLTGGQQNGREGGNEKQGGPHGGNWGCEDGEDGRHGRSAVEGEPIRKWTNVQMGLLCCAALCVLCPPCPNLHALVLTGAEHKATELANLHPAAMCCRPAADAWTVCGGVTPVFKQRCLERAAADAQRGWMQTQAAAAGLATPTSQATQRTHKGLMLQVE